MRSARGPNPEKCARLPRQDGSSESFWGGPVFAAAQARPRRDRSARRISRYVCIFRGCAYLLAVEAGKSAEKALTRSGAPDLAWHARRHCAHRLAPCPAAARRGEPCAGAVKVIAVGAARCIVHVTGSAIGRLAGCRRLAMAAWHMFQGFGSRVGGIADRS